SMYTDTPIPPDEPRAENPPDGAVIDYHLSRDAQRVTLEIVDAAGRVLRTFSSEDPTPAPADAGTADAARPDAAVPPPGPTELPSFEGALVLYANGGKFFGYKAVARSVDLDASKVDPATNTYSAYFDDSTNRVVVTLPSRTPGTLDLSAGGPAKVDVLAVGDDRAEGLLTGGKLEVVEATDKKLRARFYGDVGGVKVHGALDAVLVP
ncbi:MAG TPA: hypothetical protein PLR99_12035, partial [Polyangiaceae bacterium]|nr:hypothetical protein [Polyangiaceae bacterium]